MTHSEEAAWTPACAGVTSRLRNVPSVIPAQAGIQTFWAPVTCAGVTISGFVI
jgi:hypothetical protein